MLLELAVAFILQFNLTCQALRSLTSSPLLVAMFNMFRLVRPVSNFVLLPRWTDTTVPRLGFKRTSYSRAEMNWKL